MSNLFKTLNEILCVFRNHSHLQNNHRLFSAKTTGGELSKAEQVNVYTTLETLSACLCDDFINAAQRSISTKNAF